LSLLFGDGLPTDVTAWVPEHHHDDLTAGSGQVLVETIATLLGATIVPV